MAIEKSVSDQLDEHMKFAENSLVLALDAMTEVTNGQSDFEYLEKIYRVFRALLVLREKA